MNRQGEESASPVARLRGMTDLSGESYWNRDSLQRRLTALLNSHGYQPLDTPLLEPTELFLRKSGGELASQLFSFNDPVGRTVSLRPEFTAPAIRHYLELAREIELPVRWCYSGPVFRFDASTLQDDSPAGSQFTQLGAELLGSSGVLADVELMTLATSALSEAGISGWTLRLADLDVLNSLLVPVGLSERARAFVVQNVPRLAEGESAITQLMDESRRLHVVGRHSDDDYLSQAVQGLDDDEARSVLLGVLRSNPLDQLGQRKPEEVVERLLRKIRFPDAEDGLRLALQMASELAQVQGEAQPALAAAAETLRRAGADASAVGRLAQVVDLLPEELLKPGSMLLDFGLVRGLAYYNGIVFEVSHDGWRSPLGGGGRYDGLARDLGGDATLPALGFAYNLDALAELAPSQLQPDGGEAESVLVTPDGDGAQSLVLKVAREYRERGARAEIDVSGRSIPEALEYAGRRGLKTVVLVDSEGTVRTREL